MVISQSEYYISPEEYLEGEKVSEIKHEYIDGRVYAMAGASDAHVTVSMNVAMLLRNHLRGSSCRVYMLDMKAQIDVINRYFYPDVMVTCDIRDRESEFFKSHPCLIIEVLSESTEGYDRGKKFASYRHLESLQEYVIISPDRMSVECFRRNEEGHWVLYPYEKEQEVYLTSVDFCCAIAAIYEDVLLVEDNIS
ncbi:Uma2 family endonuclease [Komarekiella sp. 'clone 1']|uniref:Uma2 family endonuclease n=1 Tax=Komarekiella delphini-convector SJRDD-AB1 TaxID=2593771 RepID=A0AA40SVV9_9NOST|nr:Uma2 family endonuclease [Komarekiella delphini-convector]MBD6615880.1 Uma2 family endonuclease [Komarekiella delphini-convector SJRDD-AB1]